MATTTRTRPGTGKTAAADPAKLALSAEVHRRLCGEYDCPIPYFHTLDPLSELVSSLLSHRTRNADSGRAFRELRRRFPTWADVRDADPAEVEAAIDACTWPEQKGPRVQQILRRISEERGGLADDTLDFLADLPVPEARAWLERLPGVGPKTSAAVLNFSRLRRPALPVDSHHHRVAVRLGLIPKSMSVGPSHAALERLLPPDADGQTVYDVHEVFMLHGQQVCRYRSPKCTACVLLDLCPTGAERAGAERAGAEQVVERPAAVGAKPR